MPELDRTQFLRRPTAARGGYVVIVDDDYMDDQFRSLCRWMTEDYSCSIDRFASPFEASEGIDAAIVAAHAAKAVLVVVLDLMFGPGDGRGSKYLPDYKARLETAASELGYEPKIIVFTNVLEAAQGALQGAYAVISKTDNQVLYDHVGFLLGYKSKVRLDRFATVAGLDAVRQACELEIALDGDLRVRRTYPLTMLPPELHRVGERVRVRVCEEMEFGNGRLVSRLSADGDLVTEGEVLDLARRLEWSDGDA